MYGSSPIMTVTASATVNYVHTRGDPGGSVAMFMFRNKRVDSQLSNTVGTYSEGNLLVVYEINKQVL